MLRNGASTTSTNDDDDSFPKSNGGNQTEGDMDGIHHFHINGLPFPIISMLSSSGDVNCGDAFNTSKRLVKWLNKYI